MAKHFGTLDIQSSGGTSNPQLIIGDEGANALEIAILSDGSWSIEPIGGNPG